MSDVTRETAPPRSGRQRKKTPPEPERKGPSLFTVVTVIAGILAVALILWRISKAWRIEYGGGPRERPAVPAGGAFGPPGGAPRPPPASTPSSPGE